VWFLLDGVILEKDPTVVADFYSPKVDLITDRGSLRIEAAEIVSK
jgi:hypothetical protein